MKDIYELINDIDIDEAQIEIMEVSELEKAKAKNNLKKSIKKEKKWKKNLVAAVLLCSLIGGTGVVGIMNPAYAAEIPIVGDIFRFLDNGRTGAYDKYKEYADAIGAVKESNGVKVTIKEAVFDGKTLTYTYEIESNKDLGETPFLNANGPSISIKDYNGSLRGTSGVKKVSDNVYVGKDEYTLDDERKSIDFELNFTGIGDMSSESNKTVEGNWNFKINIKALDSIKQPINKKLEQKGIKLNIESISKTPASFTLTYSQEVPKELLKKYFIVDTLMEEVKDDLGNIYTTASFLTDPVREGDNAKRFIAVFGSLNPNATKLIITPKVHLSNDVTQVSSTGDGKEIDTSPIIDKDHPKSGEIKLDNIIIDLEK